MVRRHLARVGASVRLRRVPGVPAVWRRDRGGARAGRRRRRLPLLRDRRPGRGPAGAGRAGPATGVWPFGRESRRDKECPFGESSVVSESLIKKYETKLLSIHKYKEN